MNKIIIVGGGSAGWMTAATLIKQFPEKDITLIESPNTPTIGVGESTLGQLNNWLKFLEVEDKDWMPHCDATYKISIRFEDFCKKGESFHYPFGNPMTEGVPAGLNCWWFKKFLNPEIPYDDYAKSYYPLGLMADKNRITDTPNEIMDYDFEQDVAYHMDAIKFGIWLKDHYAIPRGVKYIQEDIDDIQQDENGIKSVNGYEADLFFDCTGFKSLLINKTLGVPWKDYSEMLPNDSAWAAQSPIVDKDKEIVPYTNCHAIENGWVWETPLWTRWGRGYVYSSKFVSDEQALEEFKRFLGRDDLQFRNLKFKTGIHEKLWHKNVVAIGLSAGFLEPLESSGLLTIHEFLMFFLRNSHREKITQWDRDNFNMMCTKFFDNFAQFVAFHYAVTQRDDTEYWKYCSNKEWDISEFVKLNRWENYQFIEDSGYHCIAAGGHWGPTDQTTLEYANMVNSENRQQFYAEWYAHTTALENRKRAWDAVSDNYKTTYKFLEEKIYGTLC